MKKRSIIIFIFCCVFLFNPNTVLAHPGRTDNKGCHTCKTNCPDWGLETGEYHCHSGNTYKNSKGQTFNSDGTLISENASLNSNSNNETTNSNSNASNNSSNESHSAKPNTSSNSNNQTIKPAATPKSSDNTLKSLTIDGENIEILDKMSYETKKDKIDIAVETNDAKANYEINNNTLEIGKNTIDIKVTAENGNIKTYILNVKRLSLSNNTNIKIIVDDKKVFFLNEQGNIEVSSDTTDLEYKYVLEDDNSTVTIDGDKNLKAGENLVTFTVTAEDGTSKIYKLTVNKDEENDILSTALGLTAIGGVGAYYLSKKSKIKNI